MTRRIAISILLTVWLVLILAGGLAYYVTRSMLVADLDATLLARVSSLPEIERPSSLPNFTADTRDRYIIQNPEGQIDRPQNETSAHSPAAIHAPEIVSATFTTLADGTRVRTITVKAFAKRILPANALIPVTVVYSGPADRLYSMLERLLLSLGIFGLLAGVATAAVAVIVAKAALLPLRATAAVIGAISERNLDSRIAIQKLPPELAPVGLKLNDLLARLETAFAQRKQFLADASHELRTPVAALVTTLEVTLAKTRTAEDYQRSLTGCLTDARLLQQLVQALMDQVRSEQFTSENSIEISPVRVTAVLQHCAKIAATLAVPRNIQLDLHLPENITALTDELKIRSMVTNLLSNAVEYTPPGGQVTLTLELLPLPANLPTQTALPIPDELHTVRQLLRITVTDTGPGISPEHAPHLFEPFYRADKVRTNAEAHLGLGLFLVRAHALSLGGSCRVDSAPRLGASFIIDIPAAVLPPQSPADESLSTANALQEMHH